MLKFMALKSILSGQTNYDMAMELYGTFDLIIKLAIDNSLSDLSAITTSYLYDENEKNKNSNYIGYPYANGLDVNSKYCAIPTGFQIVSKTSTTITIRFDNPQSLTYQYAYNTTGLTPQDSDWKNTNSSIVIITGVNNNTNIYSLFLRAKCNSKSFSSISKIVMNVFAVADGLYSFYKLNSSYTGKCLRVRRSSDNVEQDIGFVNGYFDTASFNTFIGANTAYVTKWYDQSGNNRNWVQTTAIYQPTTNGTEILFHPTGVAGNWQFLQQTDIFGTSASAGTYVISYVVSKQDTPLTYFGPMFMYDDYGASLNKGFGIRAGNTSSNINYMQFYNPGGTLIAKVNKNLITTPFQQAIANPTDYRIYSLICNGFNTMGYNKFLLAQDAGYIVGQGVTWNGRMKEVILFNKNISSYDTYITDNINSRYSIY